MYSGILQYVAIDIAYIVFITEMFQTCCVRSFSDEAILVQLICLFRLYTHLLVVCSDIKLGPRQCINY